MNTPLLTTQQLQEMDIRMNGVVRHNHPTRSMPIEDVFSVQLAKQIQNAEELRFALLLVRNALEMGQSELALAQCKKALGV